MSGQGTTPGAASKSEELGKPAQLPPVDVYLNALMGSDVEAQFKTFTQLWNSSHSLRLAIEGFVQREKSTTPRSSPGSSNSDQPDCGGQTGKKSTPIPPELVRKKVAQSYGGLGYRELLMLLEKHKAGKRDLGVYLLVRTWKRSETQSELPDFKLAQLTQSLTGQAIRENQSDFFREIADTIDFLRQEEYEVNGIWDHDPGQWWQFHLLLYVLDHPKDKYPIRNFIKYFEDEVGTNEMPTAKTIRSFCRKNKIALDSKPGAPRKKT